MAPKQPPNQVSEIVNINPTQVPHRALHGPNMAEIHCAFFWSLRSLSHSTVVYPAPEPGWQGTHKTIAAMWPNIKTDFHSQLLNLVFSITQLNMGVHSVSAARKYCKKFVCKFRLTFSALTSLTHKNEITATSAQKKETAHCDLLFVVHGCAHRALCW